MDRHCYNSAQVEAAIRALGGTKASKPAAKRVSRDSSLAERLRALEAHDPKLFEWFMRGGHDKTLNDLLETAGLID
jgi:hypothetical protein